ncbi:hypothetical protein BLX87_05150 [Bacillus sp. VT-16-64]|nr:hypothetical protein BLX87_05150 [Bacillus sp. VT-16-64]
MKRREPERSFCKSEPLGRLPYNGVETRNLGVKRKKIAERQLIHGPSVSFLDLFPDFKETEQKAN